MFDSEDVISRTWIFEADVRGYYIPKKPLVIDNFELKTIEDDKKGTKYLALLTVEAKDLRSAEKLAEETFARIFKALILFTGRGFEYEIKEGTETTFGKQGKREHITFRTITFPFVKELKSEMTDKTRIGTQELLELLQKSDLVSDKAIEYFLLGTNLRKWPKEAFLPFFKVLELISNKFLPEFTKKIREKIPDLSDEEIKRLASNKRKIINACEILNIPKDDKKIKKIVNVRNRHDIAHATLDATFDKETIESCRQLARDFIVGYMKSL